MGTWNGADELGRAALSKEIAWHRFKERERKVRRDFWTALKQFAGRLPFIEDLVASYYCALDPVRGILLAALAYFIVRWRIDP
jgi:uncharacterized membrane protein YkvA (DUF1232 family)